MTTLIITLPLDAVGANTTYDYVLTPDGQQVSAQSQAPLALLPGIGNAGERVALVPAGKLSWHQMQLPKGTLGRRLFQAASTQRVRAVLDGLLEDRLLDDTAQLHFALAPQARDGSPVWVAVCDRAWLYGALQVLEQAGQPVSRIVPEFWPDELTGSVQVLGEPGQARLVFTAQGGVAVWPLSPAAVALLNWPQTAEVVAEPALAALAEQLFQRPVRLAQAAQRALHCLQSPWDLAQFELLNSSRSRAVKRWLGSWREFAKARRWRAARISVWALVGVNLLGLNAWAWQEKARLNAQRKAIQAVLTDTFPSVRVVVDAPFQMAREVAALQHASGMPSGRDLERMLAAFAEVAPAGSAPVTLDFVPGELRLTGLALTPEALASVTFKLKPLTYDAALTGDSLLIKQGAQP